MQNEQPYTIETTRKLLSDRGICVIIPTYNNAGTVTDVVSRSQEYCKDVIVVCDGCTDNTIELLQSMATVPDIVDLRVNKGKGAALKKGFRHALERGFSYAITLDADGQHYPEDIPSVLKANIDNPGALIVGSRANLKDMERSKGSKFANGFSNFWFAVQTGNYLPDTQTGYRLYPLKKLHGLSLLTSRYEAELELMVLASWHGARLVSTPVRVFYPSREERISHFRPVRDFMRITLLNSVLCILAVVYGLPLAIIRFILTCLRTLLSLFIFIFYSVFVMTPVTYIYMAFGKDEDKKKYNIHRILYSSARFVQDVMGVPGIKFSKSNPHGEDFSRPSVIICNHQSHLDLISILAFTPKLVIMTADWVWNNPLYKYVIRTADFLPASAGIETIETQLQLLVEKGYSIMIYPEGTRSLDCSINRFHKGAFYVADKLGLDILPVVVYGTGKALPKHGRYLRKWPVHTHICKRMDASELAGYGNTYKERASGLRKFYISTYNEIANKIEQDV